MIFKAVEVFVPFTARFASVWFFLFHAYCARVRDRRYGVHNGKRAISVLFQFL